MNVFNYLMILLALVPTQESLGVVIGFDDNFSDGDFSAPHWDGVFQTRGRFVDGGYRIDGFANEILIARISGEGSFRTIVEFSGHLGQAMFPSGEPAGGIAMFTFGAIGLTTSILQEWENPDDTWEFFNFDNGFDNRQFIPQPDPSDIVRMEVEFDLDTLRETPTIDLNIEDEVEPISLPSNFDEMPLTSDAPRAELSIGHTVTMGPPSYEMDILLRRFAVLPLEPPGDVNSDGMFDLQDLEKLNQEIRNGGTGWRFDLNGDLLVNDLDRENWIHSVKQTYFGDANLDGIFSSADLVQVFVAAEYEDLVPENSTWSTGDWNGDSDFTSRDLVVAFQDGGYEKGPRNTALAVPEPQGLLPLMLIVILAMQQARNKRRRGSYWLVRS